MHIGKVPLQSHVLMGSHTHPVTQHGGGVAGGGKEGEREISPTLETVFAHPFKRGKEEEKCGAVCPSLNSQQNERLMGGVTVHYREEGF